MSNPSDTRGSLEADDESTLTSLDSLLLFNCDGCEMVLQDLNISERYNDVAHKQELISVLNQYSDTYPNLENLVISSATHPDFICTILLHFVRKHSHSMHSFLLLHYCDVSEFFTRVNEFSSNAVSLNRTIIIGGASIVNNKATCAAIENCSFFTTWNFTGIDHANIIFFMNSLAQNVYIQSLGVSFCPDGQEEEEMFIDSVINLVNCTKTLSKLELDFSRKTLVSERAVTGLVDALINAEVITGLSFRNVSFDNLELLIKFQCVFKNKSNIRTLVLDSNIFCINSNFNGTFFSNLLESVIRNNKNSLREFYFDFLSMNGRQASQEIISFFELLKDSCIEKLIIRAGGNFEVSLIKRLLINSIPFMGQLCSFDCFLLRGLQKIFINAIGKCSRTLVEVDTGTTQFEFLLSAEVKTRVKKFIERNSKLTTCIEEKTKFCISAWPKIFSIAKPTGPDATFHFLCNLGLSVGPDESLSTKTPSIVSNNTTATAAEQYKRKFL